MVTLDVFAVLLMGLLVLYVERVRGVLLTYRGVRVITCPGTGEPAAVELAAWRAATRPGFGRRSLRIHQCSEWPARRNCDHACVQQIAAAPADSLVPNIVTRWYENRACVCCGTPLQNTHAERHPPCLLNPDRKMIEWKEIPPQNIPHALATASPVCWTCLKAETHTW